MVREGDEEPTLSSSLGHIPGTALPGVVGNVGVAGHRDTFFRRLQGIRENDVLKFETPHGTYTYEVAETQIVKPSDVGVLRQGSSQELTLVTCYPFVYVGNAPERFIVKARLVASPNPDSIAQQRQKPEPEPAVASRPAPVIAFASSVQREEPAKTTERASRSEVELKGRKITAFSAFKGHTKMLAPGVLMGVSDLEPDHDRFTLWVAVKANRHTMWMPNHHAGSPIIFYNRTNGDRYEVTITRVDDDGVNGYVTMPAHARGDERASLLSAGR
jgi:LPXTG-site transpeptidase (sortase) family protein